MNKKNKTNEKFKFMLIKKKKKKSKLNYIGGLVPQKFFGITFTLGYAESFNICS